MSTLFELISDPDIVLALEPEELAGVAMELITSTDSYSPSRLHPTSFAHPQTIGQFPENKRKEIEFALLEAWNWLVQEGLIAPTTDGAWHFITRRGKKLKNRTELAAYRNTILLPRKLLHPNITNVSWSAFLRGEYDTSVFQSFKELEIKIREKASAKSDDYGVVLARKAFHPQSGPLADMSATEGERDALMQLVAGALGSYKNPHSHRKVHVGAADAIEMIMLASHLYKIVDDRGNS
jgi:uncharacterized protein (TIGR02391 family)